MLRIKNTLLKSLPAVAVAVFLAATIVYAWTEPSVAPPLPDPNVAVPINDGSSSQNKTGGLGVGGVFTAYNSVYLSTLGGNVRIGDQIIDGLSQNRLIIQPESSAGYGEVIIYPQTNTDNPRLTLSQYDAPSSAWYEEYIQQDANYNLELATALGREIQFLDGTTQNVVIDANGNMGIGDPSPAVKLEIKGNVNSGLQIIASNTTNPIFQLSDNGVNALFSQFDVNGNENVRFTTNAGSNSWILSNLGIGTASPNTSLDVNGAFSVRGAGLPAVSPAGQGRIYFSSSDNRFKVSENGGGYVDLVGGAGGGGTVMQVNSGTGLTGGPITVTGTLSLTAAYQDGSAYDGRFVNVDGDTMTGKLTTSLTSDDMLTFIRSGTTKQYNFSVGTDGAFVIKDEAGSVRFKIDSSGNVGIGTAGIPGQKLEISGGNIRLDSAQGIEWGAGWNTTIRGSENFYMALRVGAADRVWITNTGNVGIGTVLPNTALDINGALSVRGMGLPLAAPAGQGRIYFDSTANRFQVSENGGGYVDLVGGAGGAGGADGQVQYNNGGALGGDSNFYWDDTNKRLRIGPSGSPNSPIDIPSSNSAIAVNINNTFDSAGTTYGLVAQSTGAGGGTARYGVVGNGSGTGNGVWGRNTGSGTGAGVYGSNESAVASGVLGLNTGAGVGVYGWVTAGGYGVYCFAGGGGWCGGNAAWSIASDGRLKTNITTISDALDKVSALRGVNFNWKDPKMGDDLKMGFIAQEVLPIVPEVVHLDKDGYYAMESETLTALLVEAVKELKAKNDALEAKIEALEAVRWQGQ